MNPELSNWVRWGVSLREFSPYGTGDDPIPDPLAVAVWPCPLSLPSILVLCARGGPLARLPL